MRSFIIIGCLMLAGCTQPPAPVGPTSTLFDQITDRDMMLNRPNTDTREARFRMLADGSGTVEFLNGTTGPQPVGWSIDGTTFCIDAAEGLMASFDCATLNITGDAVTLAHTTSDSVVRGEFVAR